MTPKDITTQRIIIIVNEKIRATTKVVSLRVEHFYLRLRYFIFLWTFNTATDD
jgi:hypothetical protein